LAQNEKTPERLRINRGLKLGVTPP